MSKMKNLRTYYEKMHSKRPVGLISPSDSVKNKILLKIIKNNVKAQTTFLDLGCGAGTFSKLLSTRYAIVSLDISVPSLKHAKQQGLSGLVLADAEKLPFSDHVFNAVLIKDLLEHLQDDVSALNETMRICNQHSVVIMYVPNDLNERTISFESLLLKFTGYSIDNDVGHIRRYNKKGFTKLLHSCGYKVLCTSYMGHILTSMMSVLSIFGLKVLGNNLGHFTVNNRYTMLFIKVLEFLGVIEYSLFKKLPGAGLFLVTLTL